MSMGNPDVADVCAVVVTYNPDGAFAERTEVVAAQVDRLLIVDNGSDAERVEAIRRTCSRLGAELIANDANRGVATALNQGMRWAAEHGYARVLTLDQDTVPDGCMAATLCRVWSEAAPSDRVAVVGCNYTDEHGRLSYPFPADRPDGLVEAAYVITSGSLHSVAAYQGCGPFRDELFIDEVDVEYCFRARARGHRVLRCHRPLMVQHLGEVRLRRVLGRDVTVRSYSPARWYYQTRNHTVVLREYFLRQPRSLTKSGINMVKRFVKMCMWETERRQKVRSVAAGLLDGIRGKFGRGPLEAAPSAPPRSGAPR